MIWMWKSPQEYPSRIILEQKLGYPTVIIESIPHFTVSGVRHGELYAVHSTQGDRGCILLTSAGEWFINQERLTADNAGTFPLAQWTRCTYAIV